MIYLDNAASTVVLPQVKEKLLACLDIYGNPSSLHEEGFKAKKLIEEAKNIIAEKLNCSTDELFFTSGATMSNSLMLQGLSGFKIGVSAIEHEDIMLLAKRYRYKIIPVDNYGFVNLEILDKLVNTERYKKVISIQMANGEIGTIQNIKEISKIVHRLGNGYLHVDATQYLPYAPIDVKKMGIDALSMSGQKIGCIKGTGLLYISKNLQRYMHSIILGKQGLIGGTPNVLGIACLGEAFANLTYENNPYIEFLRDTLKDGILGDVKIITPNHHVLPNNLCVQFNGINADSMVSVLNAEDVYCSAGSACSSGDSEPSNTLLAIGLTPKETKMCVRFSLSKYNTEEQIEKAILTINAVYELLKDLR